MQDPTHSESRKKALADYTQWVIWLALMLVPFPRSQWQFVRDDARTIH